MDAKTALQSNFYVSTLEGLVSPPENSIFFMTEHIIQDRTPFYKPKEHFFLQSNENAQKFKFEELKLSNIRYVRAEPESTCMTNLSLGSDIDVVLHELKLL